MAELENGKSVSKLHAANRYDGGVQRLLHGVHRRLTGKPRRFGRNPDRNRK